MIHSKTIMYSTMEYLLMRNIHGDSIHPSFFLMILSISLAIFMSSLDGTIVNIADMAPQTDDAHCSARPVRYALEMAQGWFATHGIKEGNRIDGLP